MRRTTRTTRSTRTTNSRSEVARRIAIPVILASVVAFSIGGIARVGAAQTPPPATDESAPPVDPAVELDAARERIRILRGQLTRMRARQAEADAVARRYGSMIDRLLNEMRDARKSGTIDPAAIAQRLTKSTKQSGAPDAAWADIQGKLVKIWQWAKQRDVAVDHARKALAANLSGRGELSRKTVQSRLDLASLLASLGQLSEAAEVYERAADVVRDNANLRSAYMLQVLRPRAQALYELREWESFAATAEELLPIQLAGRPWEERASIAVMIRRAEALQALGRFEEAATSARDAMAAAVRINGQDTSSTIDARSRLAMVLAAAGHDEEARAVGEEVDSLARFFEAIERPRKSATYGRYLVSIGAYERAEPYILRPFEDRSGNSRTKNDVIQPLIELYEGWGRNEEAAKYRAMLSAR